MQSLRLTEHPRGTGVASADAMVNARFVIGVSVTCLIACTGVDDRGPTTRDACSDGDGCGEREKAGPEGLTGPGTEGGADAACGNGVLEPGEACDRQDFGTATCESLGFPLGGKLLCADDCSSIDTTNCRLEQEVCNDWRGNDLDADLDCTDSDCADSPHCQDACTDLHVFTIPEDVGVPNLFVNFTRGSSSVHQPSCTAESGREIVLAVESPVDGRLRFRVNSGGEADYSLSARTSCGEPATEVACTNNLVGGRHRAQLAVEMIGVDVTKGQVVYVLVDGVDPDQEGIVVVEVMIAAPETGDFLCNNSYDDDIDGHLDCDDSECQATLDCVPGAGAPGSACELHADCSAKGPAPFCLAELDGWPGGACSEFCDIVAPDCPAGSECVELALGPNLAVHGVCLETCCDSSDCRPEYACTDRGGGVHLCTPGPESACGDFADNDADTLTDCEDPDCQGQAECAPGANPTGAPCTQANECHAVGSDPLCLDEANMGHPDGYCSQFCTDSSECGEGAACVDFLFFPSRAAQCFDRCTSADECRPGYACRDIGALEGDFCTPI